MAHFTKHRCCRKKPSRQIRRWLKKCDFGMTVLPITHHDFIRKDAMGLLDQPTMIQSRQFVYKEFA